MYNKLTKKIIVAGQQCVACSNFGTKMCLIHNGTPDCGHCKMFGAILNQLNYFEELLFSKEKAEEGGDIGK